MNYNILEKRIASFRHISRFYIRLVGESAPLKIGRGMWSRLGDARRTINEEFRYLKTEFIWSSSTAYNPNTNYWQGVGSIPEDEFRELEAKFKQFLIENIEIVEINAENEEFIHRSVK